MVTDEEKYKNERTYIMAYYMIMQVLENGTVNKDFLMRLNKRCAEVMGCDPIEID